MAPAVRGTEKKAVWLDTPRNKPESAVRHKSHNFLNNVRGRLELPSLKELEGLFVTEEGFVAEGVTSNVFWMKDGELFTPAIETGILPGTTRAFIIELARVAGITVNEGFYGKEHVEDADELFVTNAVQELVPLSAIEEILLPGASGVYYQKLHELYIQAIDEMKEGRLLMELAHARDVYSLVMTEMDFKKETVIMGILNVTPDSFSDGGKYGRIDAALKHAEEMLRDGAKIIDVGGESTRPGHVPVSLEEELERTVPIIEAIDKRVWMCGVD